MYAYSLLVQLPGANTPNGLVPVRPGPDLELPTLDALKEQCLHDLGYVPDWLVDCPPTEYLQVEDEHTIEGIYFVADIEGSEEAELAPVARRLSFLLNHGDNRVWG